MDNNVLYDQVIYEHVYLYLFLLVLEYMVRYLCQTALIISDVWWTKANKYWPFLVPI